MRHAWKMDLDPSAITPESVWRARRRFLRGVALAPLALGASSPARAASDDQPSGLALPAPRNAQWSTNEPVNSWRDITTYNNFYEFGTGKGDPARYAGQMRLDPWTVRIDGAVRHPVTLDIDDLRKLAPLEERIYRLRCVEAWSMVIPWTGYSLSHLLAHVEPTEDAKYVVFTTAVQPKAMPGVQEGILDWPYVEGLRMDEAMHPLTLLTFGLYGHELPAQDGAPMRVIVPWKYGFKSGKSLTRIHLQATQPTTSWMRAAPQEYGFYANVNPAVPHPRWSQATERRIGSGLFAARISTQLFNGYAKSVAGLYQGMDLRRDF
ncbi:protein-methionine-sulfoxide reductase catalytic subunit MsrP [Candidimonas nitroreducens]|jgi:sulfoxide reductase catalytic subunit YedY|uniref:Protein-methionine-sulfoxide reductase catalytic subunit MsrP n=1 Tax=Candidimonas nitroreducens TaxID=683354 RepID=A0A225MWY0_9BURK|nr:protein-methionine-sulfoxide reductase catalytic subunit MsrP [Candidimonas nitroreducens]OWT65582.1 mononuclear molybdenum enzyme YedY [Candidimonas nitroreducens]